MRKLSISDTTSFVVDILVGHTCTRPVAHSVAEALVTAEAYGQTGHGLIRLPAYVDMLESGKICGQAVPVLAEIAPSVLRIDAGDGFVDPALDLAVRQLPISARAQGISLAAIHRSSHCGVAGIPCEKLAREGLVAMLFANAPSAMAPWDGTRPLFGTNPIAFAAPCKGRAPIVVDVSLSKMTRGALAKSWNKGRTIPQGVAIDRFGHPTLDPHPTRK